MTERCSPVAVGTGFIKETSSADIRGSKIVSVRGPLTRAKIGGECLLGDPGILAAEAARVSVVGGQGTVVAPHYIDHELALKLPGLPTIDVRQAPKVVISELARFDRVVTSSLHVIIAADSLGIERVWAPHPEVIGNGFKFHDYSASLTSAIEPWVTTTAHPSHVAALKEQVWEALGRARELLCL